MNAKRKGTRLEHKTIRHLENEGYECVRAAASLGLWDIIAIAPSHMRLIQVKANRRPGSVELEGLRGFRCPSNCSREVWIWKDRARDAVVEIL